VGACTEIVAASPRPHAVQSPAAGQRLRLKLRAFRDHLHDLVWLHKLDRSVRALDDRRKVSLCSAELEEWHSTLIRMADHLTCLLGSLAHGIDLGICCTTLHHDDPLLLMLSVQGGLASIGRLVVHDGHTGNELGALLRGCLLHSPPLSESGGAKEEADDLNNAHG